MNKKRVDSLINPAIKVLKNLKIADENGKIDSTFRAQISAFGASVIMGSFKSAVAFYAKQGNSDVDRALLLRAMHCLVSGCENTNVSGEDIFNQICAPEADLAQIQEDYINASIALKLAMNFFDLDKGTKEEKHEESEPAVQ